MERSMYLDFTLSTVLSFVLAVLLAIPLIPELHKLKFGQEVREDGPETHLKKKGTPTMGGIIFLLSLLVPSVFYALRFPKIRPALFLTLGFAAVGFLDDSIKVLKHHSEGLNPKQKFFLQLLITFLFSLWICLLPDHESALRIPFTRSMLKLGPFYIPALLFIVTATDNGANFTDGLDGLCSSVTAVISLFLGIYAIFTGERELVPLCGAMLGALLGFLCFNAYPARVFMGDTGSLALGGFVSALAIELGIPLYIPLFAFIYLLEVLSVIIQVSYFKLSHGRRIFRMAPIHHHFELLGWSETRVVTVFTIISLLLSLLSFALLIL